MYRVMLLVCFLLILPSVVFGSDYTQLTFLTTGTTMGELRPCAG